MNLESINTDGFWEEYHLPGTQTLYTLMGSLTIS